MTRESTARIVAKCEKAGISFNLEGNQLTVCFKKLDWSRWPELKAQLEDLGGLRLVEFLESDSKFRTERSRQAWSLTSRRSDLSISRFKGSR